MKKIKRLCVLFAAGTMMFTAVGIYVYITDASQKALFIVFIWSLMFSVICVGCIWWLLAGLKRNTILALENRRKGYKPQRLFAEDVRKLMTRVKNYQSSQLEEAEYKETQLQVLMSQINPHFLYNTLESIRGQALMAGDEIVADMAEMLAMFFRYCISRKGTFVALRDEIQNINAYLKIMKFRLPDRFEFRFVTEDSEVLKYEIPKLTLQPIVENAVLHGLQDCTTGGMISVRVVETEEQLKIYVRDNGSGIPAETLQEMNERLRSNRDLPKESRSASHGIALYNINRRIKLAYGVKYGVRIFSTEQMGTNVMLNIPKKEFDEQK